MYFLEDLDEEEYEIAIKVRWQPKLAKKNSELSDFCLKIQLLQKLVL